MDQTLLVRQGRELLRALDAKHVSPRFALWTRQPESDQWKLWVVPHPSIKSKRVFYSVITDVLRAAPARYPQGFDISDVEIVTTDKIGLSPDRPFFVLKAGDPPVSARNVSLGGTLYPEAIFLRAEN